MRKRDALPAGTGTRSQVQPSMVQVPDSPGGDTEALVGGRVCPRSHSQRNLLIPSVGSSPLHSAQDQQKVCMCLCITVCVCVVCECVCVYERVCTHVCGCVCE